MHIIFATSTCSKKTYENIFKARKKKMIDPSQKFFNQLFYGISKNDKFKVKLSAITGLPVSFSTIDKYTFKRKIEHCEGIKYVYVPFLNGKFLRFITTGISVFCETINMIIKSSKEEKVILICDPLDVHISKPARIAAKLLGVKTIGVVTDIPQYATNMKDHKYSYFRYKFQHYYEKLSMKEVNKYDGYIILTEFMNNIVNPKNKPVIVIEGSVDINTLTIHKKQNDINKKIAVYAGGIYEKYGVKQLVESFIRTDILNTELHIYGEGTYVNELIRVSKINKKVKYKGCVLNSELVEIESKADLLINPRFSNEDYTRYSFPSKTLEYLSSGTAVLSTRLPGIPKDYMEYLFWFDNESSIGMSEKLKEVLSKNKGELLEFGEKGKEFAINNKSNIVQGLKIVDFCNRI